MPDNHRCRFVAIGERDQFMKIRWVQAWRDLRPGAPGGAGSLLIDGRPFIADGVVVAP
jgi:hypothetical protein